MRRLLRRQTKQASDFIRTNHLEEESCVQCLKELSKRKTPEIPTKEVTEIEEGDIETAVIKLKYKQSRGILMLIKKEGLTDLKFFFFKEVIFL